MRSDPRQLTHDLARRELARRAPEELGEFEVVFDELYRILAEEAPETDLVLPADGSGIPFDAPWLDETVLAHIVWVTFTLVREALWWGGSAGRLEKIGERIGKLTGEMELAERLLAEVKGTLLVQPDVSGEDATGEATAPPATDGGPPAAARLLVSCDPARRPLTVDYALDTSELLAKPCGSVELARDPWEYFRDVLRDVEALGDEAEPGGTGARARLEDRGVDLFRKLVPEPLHQELGALRDRGASLQIVSDEPWIPWELLRFPGPEGAFLAEAFRLTRWRRGVSPARELPLTSLALVVVRDSGLTATAGLKTFFSSLEPKGGRVHEIPARYEAIREGLVADRHDAWHLAGHGGVRGGDADSAHFELEGRVPLTPQVLANVERLDRRPLVFLNACQAAQGGLSLTGVGGWAPAFLDAGAGAFLAPLWSVYDSRADLFARSFYRAFAVGTSLAEATRAARGALRRDFPGDPSWLAWAVYGHPAARAQTPQPEDG